MSAYPETPRPSPRWSRRGKRRSTRALASLAIAAVGLVAGLSILNVGSAAEKPSGMAADAAPPPPSPLVADHPLHEFGDIPITGGVVEAEFQLTNQSAAPAHIVASYTSCMCTTAVLAFPDGISEGPFGMPGHDLPVTLDRDLAAGETMTVTVHFDPLAHGPDATGPVVRKVAVQDADGGTAVVTFTANVVPG